MKPRNDNRNGTDAEICDKKSSDDLATTTAILHVLSLDDEHLTMIQGEQQGKGKSNKKSKKMGGKVEEMVSSSSDVSKV